MIGDEVASGSNSDPRFRNDGFGSGEGALEVYASGDNGDICEVVPLGAWGSIGPSGGGLFVG